MTAPRRVLLVCGSRTLARIKGAEAWGMEILRRETAWLRAGDHLLTGAATGPDCWARMALPEGPVAVEYLPSGMRVEHGLVMTVRAWTLAPERDPRLAPLARNRAMVAGVQRAMAAGWEGRCVGLLDPASTTHGTKYTLRIAREAGIPVVRHSFEG